MKKNIKIIAKNINETRKKKGHTLQTLAYHLNMSYQQVAKYISGKNRISADTLFEIAQVLQVDIKQLYKGCK